MNKIITTSHAPAAIGPYSQAVQSNQTLYVSGQLPIDPSTGVMIESDISLQTKQVLEHIRSILISAGYEIIDIVKVTVYLTDMNMFARMNQEYASFFGSHKPARATVEVSRLPKDSLIEIDCICSK